jgi:LmbE family N-acetylglucosaminyl deacetylase
MINENQIVPYTDVPLPVEEGPWLVFAPHADDESFGMGGTLAKATETGIQVHLVVMTDGALGGQLENLAEIRKAEARSAAAMLGLEAPVFLNNRDRELKVEDETIYHVLEQIREINPAAVFFPGVFELHPDHRMTALIVWQALQNLGQTTIKPVSYEILVQSPVNMFVDISAYISAKKSVMGLYESQLGEKSYIDIALAMNSLRSLTLGPETYYAEGFYVYEQGQLKKDLMSLMTDKIHSYLEQ